MRYPVMVAVGATQWTAKELVLISEKSRPVGESRAEEKGGHRIYYLVYFSIKSKGLILTV